MQRSCQSLLWSRGLSGGAASGATRLLQVEELLCCCQTFLACQRLQSSRGQLRAEKVAESVWSGLWGRLGHEGSTGKNTVKIEKIQEWGTEVGKRASPGDTLTAVGPFYCCVLQKLEEETRKEEAMGLKHKRKYFRNLNTVLVCIHKTAWRPKAPCGLKISKSQAEKKFTKGSKTNILMQPLSQTLFQTADSLRKWE